MEATKNYQINMLCDRKGKLLMDFVGKLETLQDDWKTVCERIALPYKALPRKNATQHRHFQDYYDKESRQLVAKHWARLSERWMRTCSRHLSMVLAPVAA